MLKKIEKLLSIAQERSASDLHLNVNGPPVIRVDGRLQRLNDHPDLTEEDIKEILETVASREQVDRFLKHHELDFSYENMLIGRFRVNACFQKNTISLAFRLLMGILTPLTSLGLPSKCEELSLSPRGLILVTGPTGSGKSTSMAAMINHINMVQERYIITIEDPIEYLHKDDKSVIIQRSVGEDTESFSAALKYTLRHDPDVIVVGEMRDLTTIATAISAAETGHLVLGTLHTIDASETIHRIVEVFPEGQQMQIRLQLSQVLLAVLSQTLVPRINGGRIPACELMLCNTAIRHLIREGQVHQITSTMQLGMKDGMQTLNQSLAELVVDNIVSPDDAIQRSSNVQQLLDIIKRNKSSVMSGLV